MLKFTVLLVALGCYCCQGLQDNNYDFEEIKPSFKASKYGSLWPLPQKVQISDAAFMLSGSRFKITDAKESSAGPSCILLQNAYRRWDDEFKAAYFHYFFIFNFYVYFLYGEIEAPWCLQEQLSLLPVSRYFDYLFGGVKQQKASRSRQTDSELTELQVLITSPDSECESYPTVTSDESCESLHFLIHAIFFLNIFTGASVQASNSKKYCINIRHRFCLTQLFTKV